MTKRKIQANLKPTIRKRQIIWNRNLGTKTQRLKPKNQKLMTINRKRKNTFLSVMITLKSWQEERLTDERKKHTGSQNRIPNWASFHPDVTVHFWMSLVNKHGFLHSSFCFSLCTAKDSHRGILPCNSGSVLKKKFVVVSSRTCDHETLPYFTDRTSITLCRWRVEYASRGSAAADTRWGLGPCAVTAAFLAGPSQCIKQREAVLVIDRPCTIFFHVAELSIDLWRLTQEALLPECGACLSSKQVSSTESSWHSQVSEIDSATPRNIEKNLIYCSCIVKESWELEQKKATQG